MRVSNGHAAYLVSGGGTADLTGPKCSPLFYWDLWDYYKLVPTTPGAEAFRPLSEGGCPFVKN